MKKIIFLSSLLFMLFGASNVYAQNHETVTTSKISNINKAEGKSVILLDVGNYAEKIQSKISTSKINTKEGFQAKVDLSTNHLIVAFSKHYPNDELIILFNYLGIELTASDLVSISKAL